MNPGLTRIITLMVNEMGEATVGQLLARLEPKYTKKQIQKAVSNAREHGLIHTKGRHKGFHQRGGMSIYCPALPQVETVSLEKAVESIVLQVGTVTVSDIATKFPEKQRAQINRALDNLKNHGKVEQVRRIGMPDGSKDGCYFVPPGCTVRFNSVFDYAQRA